MGEADVWLLSERFDLHIVTHVAQHVFSVLEHCATAFLGPQDDAVGERDVGTTRDVLEEALKHQVKLQISGQLREVSVVISGRPPPHWWPDKGGDSSPTPFPRAVPGAPAGKRPAVTGEGQEVDGEYLPHHVSGEGGGEAASDETAAGGHGLAQQVRWNQIDVCQALATCAYSYLPPFHTAVVAWNPQPPITFATHYHLVAAGEFARALHLPHPFPHAHL